MGRININWSKERIQKESELEDLRHKKLKTIMTITIWLVITISFSLTLLKAFDLIEVNWNPIQGVIGGVLTNGIKEFLPK